MRRYRLAAVAVAALCAAGLSGCDRQPQSVRPYAPSDGVLANSGEIRVLNALVVAAPAGDAGVVSMTVVNRGDSADSLTDLTSGSGTVDFTGDRALEPGGAVRLGSGTAPSATIEGLNAKAGQEIVLTLSFEDASPIKLTTVVVPATGAYADLTPGPETPSPAASESESSE